MDWQQLNKLGYRIEVRFVEDANDLLVREICEDASCRLVRHGVQNINCISDVLLRDRCSESGKISTRLRSAGFWHVNLLLVPLRAGFDRLTVHQAWAAKGDEEESSIDPVSGNPPR
jgi:hypothetical protein